MRIAMCSILNFLKLIQVIFAMLLLQVILLSCWSVADANVSCIDKERQALLDFKHALLDDFGRLSSWGTAPDCCSWSGVQCNAQTGHVEMLDLHDGHFGDQPLGGEINTSLMELQHLKYFNLSYNNFNGSYIPKFLGSLTKLTYLDLSIASFAGIIPYQLGKLSSLQVLYLSYNNLVGKIPYQLGNLSSLQKLDLRGNNLVGTIPYQLGNLSSLQKLDLHGNNLVGTIPYQLGNLSSLQVLDLSYNINLVGKIPYQLGNLSSLQELDLNGNNLVGTIPYQLGNLSRLQILQLGYNDKLKIDDKSLMSTEWISNLPSLTELDLSDVSNLNSSRKWLQQIGKLPNLRNLWLQNCSLIDDNLLSMPPLHLNFSTSLVTLDLSYNKLTSSIFPWLFNLSSNLVELSLQSNQLAGSMPNYFGKSMNNLEVLDLSYNQLNGTVSDIHFDNLTKLQTLYLSNNSLTLKFSNSWVPPFQLRYLWLSQCKIGPRFPRWLHTQNNLLYLDISNAKICDSVPQWFWNLTRGMRALGINNNNITGTIPNLALDHFSESSRISLTSNQIEGSIPSFLFNTQDLDISGNKFSNFFLSCDKEIGAIVENLVALNLSYNKLSGQLFDCWNSFKSLQVLDLSNNQLSGKIPVSMGSLFQIQMLIFRNNHFSGELPYLQNYTKLQMLDMEKNELSGSIPPSWLGENKKGLEILILKMNKLDGNLPWHLCHLTRLRVLDLSVNNFTGPIPSCFNNLIAMAQRHTLNYSMSRHSLYKKGTLVGYQRFDLYLPIAWKGTELQYRDNGGLLNFIDLSHNQLSGKIPKGMGNLVELVSLNLSANNLHGKIIPEVGQLKALETLDLSRNHFSGKIPSSLAAMYWLSSLNVSSNNFSGEIPIGTQLQSFDTSCYEGNPYLCGRPLDKLCSYEDPREHRGQEDQAEDGNEVSDFTKGMYESIGPGFATGFLIVFVSLLLSRSWRHAYFTFLNKLMDYIYVTTILSMRKWHGWLNK